MTGEERHRQRPGAEIADSAPERKPDERRLARRAPDDHGTPAREERLRRARGDASADQQPDVLLDVPVVKVDEINLEVDDLQARVSLQAQVLDLLKLHVGADVSLGRVSIGIKGVEAAALLKVRLDNVAAILDRVMTTLDENPQILEGLTRGLGEAVTEVGRGSGKALEGVGEGAGGALEEVGHGAGGAVESVGQGAGGALEDIGEGAGGAVESVGQGAGGAVETVGQGAGSATESVGGNVGRAAGELGHSAGRDVEGVSQDAGDAARNAGGTPEDGDEHRRAGDARQAERPQRPRRRMPPSRREQGR